MGKYRELLGLPQDSSWKEVFEASRTGIVNQASAFSLDKEESARFKDIMVETLNPRPVDGSTDWLYEKHNPILKKDRDKDLAYKINVCFAFFVMFGLCSIAVLSEELDFMFVQITLCAFLILKRKNKRMRITKALAIFWTFLMVGWIWKHDYTEFTLYQGSASLAMIALMTSGFYLNRFSYREIQQRDDRIKPEANFEPKPLVNDLSVIPNNFSTNNEE